jgi:hypothetical protein
VPPLPGEAATAAGVAAVHAQQRGTS